MSGDHPPPGESLARLHRSGWKTRQVTIIRLSGDTIDRAEGANGENQICVDGVTAGEVWHRAVEAAVACGMIEDWPRPSDGTR